MFVPDVEITGLGFWVVVLGAGVVALLVQFFSTLNPIAGKNRNGKLIRTHSVPIKCHAFVKITEKIRIRININEFQ
jgi:hypothetical protein